MILSELFHDTFVHHVRNRKSIKLTQIDGEINDNALRVLTAFGLEVVTWDHDSNDWDVYQNPTLAAKAVNDVKTWLPALKTGGIIGLEHDLFAGEVSMSIQIGGIIAGSGAVVSPVGTCLGDSNWYSSGVLPNPVQSTSATKSLMSSSATGTATSAKPTTPAPTGKDANSSVARMVVGGLVFGAGVALLIL